MATLSREQRHFFQAFGYLHLPGLLPPEDVAWITQEHSAVFNAAGIVHAGTARSSVSSFIGHSRQLSTLLEHPAVLGAVRPLLGEDFSWVVSPPRGPGPGSPAPFPQRPVSGTCTTLTTHGHQTHTQSLRHTDPATWQCILTSLVLGSGGRGQLLQRGLRLAPRYDTSYRPRQLHQAAPVSRAAHKGHWLPEGNPWLACVRAVARATAGVH